MSAPIKFHIVTDPDDPFQWVPLIDTPDGQLDLGSHHSPGAAVDAVQKWASDRGRDLCYFTIELREVQAHG